MHLDKLNEAIYNRYILPTRRKRTDRLGLEFELPIVNIKKEPVNFDIVHAMTDRFVERYAFTEIKRDDDGFIYMAEEPGTGDNISFDCSYNTLEFSFGTETDFAVLSDRFATYYNYVQADLMKEDHMLTGMGINPGYAYNKNIPVVSERYRMLFHHLCSYKNYENEILFHDHPNFGLFSCASQIQLDVEEERLPQVLNTFTRLEPLKALLFANSIWTEDHNEFLCSRDYFWRNSLHGLNRHNVDMYGLEFESVDEIIWYIRSMSLYCVQRDGRYINFSPIRLADYFAADSLTGELFDKGAYRKVQFSPDYNDLTDLRSFKFDDLTFRGTVEFRSVCEQPVKEIMASGAFHTGLMENLDLLTECLENDHVIYHKGYNASELRRQFVRAGLPEIFDKGQISDLLIKILDMSAEGLKKRGRGEEKLLEPLYGRAESLMSPAAQIVEGMKNGKSLEDFILEYGTL